MNILKKAYDWIGATFGYANGQFQRVWFPPETKSGIVVTPRNSLETITVIRCVSIIAGAGAALPIEVVSKSGDYRMPLPDHPVSKLLNSRPNDQMSSMDFRHFLWVSYLLWGNAYAVIVRRPGSGEPIGLWPLMPEAMQVQRTTSGDLIYIYTPPGGIPKPYRSNEILHVRGISLDGLTGLSIISLAAEAIGYGRALDTYGSKLIRGGAAQRIAVTFPNPNISEESIQQLVREWETRFGNAEYYDRPVVLKAGGTVSNIGINPKDAQFLELTKMTDERIATLFGVPPHMLGMVDKTTSWGTGIGEQKQGFLTFTLQPHLVFHEKAYDRSLLVDDNTAIRHNVNSFLRSDFKTRMDGYSTAVDKGLMNRNEVRALEDLPPFDGGELYTVQAQMVPVGKGQANEN
jgi:HK97 family phage portal protein